MFRLLQRMPILSLLLLACIFSQNNNINFVEGKTCVATGQNRYLCTDDVAKARAHKWAEGDKSLKYEDLDLGVEQQMDGTQEERDAVLEVMEKMKVYFETEVLVKPEYDDVIHKW